MNPTAICPKRQKNFRPDIFLQFRETLVSFMSRFAHYQSGRCANAHCLTFKPAEGAADSTYICTPKPVPLTFQDQVKPISCQPEAVSYTHLTLPTILLV